MWRRQSSGVGSGTTAPHLGTQKADYVVGQIQAAVGAENGPAVIQSLRHEIAGFVEVNPEGAKVSRAAAASPQLESGNWYLPHPMLARWVEAFIGECAAFPAGAHDDQVDAWSQGAKRLMVVVVKRPRQVPPQRFESERSWMSN